MSTPAVIRCPCAWKENWKEKSEWLQPGSILKAAGSMAYVTDAQSQQLVIVDVETGMVVGEIDLEVTAVEMVTGHRSPVTGLPEAPEHSAADAVAGRAGEEHEHDHEEGDH